MKYKYTQLALKKYGKFYVNEVKKRLIQEGLHASGELNRSLSYDVADNVLTINMAKYGLTVEGGSKGYTGGSTGDMKSFVKNMAEWAKNKGMRPQIRTKSGRFRRITQSSYNQLGYALAKSILQKGSIKRYNYGGSGIFNHVFNETKDIVSNEVLEAYGRDLEEEIRLQLNTNNNG